MLNMKITHGKLPTSAKKLEYRQVSHLWAGVSHLFRQEVKYLMIYCGQMVRAEAMGSTGLKNFTL